MNFLWKKQTENTTKTLSDLNLGGESTMWYIDGVLYNFNIENFIMLLTNFTQMNLIKLEILFYMRSDKKHFEIINYLSS